MARLKEDNSRLRVCIHKMDSASVLVLYYYALRPLTEHIRGTHMHM